MQIHVSFRFARYCIYMYSLNHLIFIVGLQTATVYIHILVDQLILMLHIATSEIQRDQFVMRYRESGSKDKMSDSCFVFLQTFTSICSVCKTYY